MATEQLLPISGNFENKSIVSIEQFDREDVELVMEEAADMADMVGEYGSDDLLSDKVTANVFFEPSTRTFLSFEAAAKRLGASTISTQGVEYSSVSKGESFQDTILTIGRFADTIALRHNEEGAAAIAAEVSKVPVINGGDGIGEHPTQALLDLYTIIDDFKDVDGLNITMVGDLKHGRTVHSLAMLLSKYDTHMNFVSPEELSMPGDVVKSLSNEHTSHTQTTDLDDVIADSDVLYVTRIQKERFEVPTDYEKHKEAYSIDAEVMKKLGQEAIVMHPLPRVTEIHPEVDSDPRAAYFDQVENGMYVRMALLAMVNGRSITS